MKKRKKNQQTIINQTITPKEKKGVMNYLRKILTTGRLSIIIALLSVIVTIVIYYAGKTPQIDTARQETKDIAENILKTIPQDLTDKVENDECMLLKTTLGFIMVGTEHYLKMQESALYDQMVVDDDLLRALNQDMQNRESIIFMTGTAISLLSKILEKYFINYYGYGQLNLNTANTVKNSIDKSEYDKCIKEINSLLEKGKSKEALEELRKLHNNLEIQEMYKSIFSYMKMMADILTPRYQALLKLEQESK